MRPPAAHQIPSCNLPPCITQFGQVSQIATARMYAGPSSSTQQELYHLLHQDKQRLLGLVQPTSASEAEVEDLLQSLSHLNTALLQQGQGKGHGGAEMILANGIWTNKVEVRAEYAAHMHKLFQVGTYDDERITIHTCFQS